MIHAKLTAHVADMANPLQLAALPSVLDVYCALGTTIKVAGSQAAFKAIDLDAVVAVAKASRVNKAVRIGVASAMAAQACALRRRASWRGAGQAEPKVAARGVPSGFHG